jgi:hypothetical protein
MIAALPQGTEKAIFDPKAGAFNSNAFLQEVLVRLVRLLEWPAQPTITRTVLSGFSGGGLTVNQMLAEEGGPRAPAKMGELILFDAVHGKSGKPGDEVAVWNFLEGKLNQDLAAIKNKPPAEQLKYIRESGFRFRGITTGQSGYGRRYRYLQDKLYSKGDKDKEMGWFPRHASELGGLDSAVYLALSANYQVIFSKNKKHGTLMGDPNEEGAQGHLQEALLAGPPPTSKGKP